METITFTKMSGAGNDFIMVDACTKRLELDWPRIALKWCRPKTGIGADGLIVIEPHAECDFAMRIFNADGSEAEMCGNGARCAALFARGLNIAGPSMRFRTGAGVIGARVTGDDAAIAMTEPKDLETGMSIQTPLGDRTVHFVNTGVPHAVVFTEDLDGEPVFEVGRFLRHHGRFAPEGTNVNFVQVSARDTLRVRTYERGVEDETLACGTGAAASAIVAHHLGIAGPPPVKVRARGGDLTVEFGHGRNGYFGVWLKGPVQSVFRGEIEVKG
jgi:diaminopimelate epimerase